MLINESSKEWQSFVSTFPEDVQKILIKVKPLYIEENILYWNSNISMQEKEYLKPFMPDIMVKLNQYFGVKTANNLKLDEIAVNFIQKAYEKGFTNIKVELC